MIKTQREDERGREELNEREEGRGGDEQTKEENKGEVNGEIGRTYAVERKRDTKTSKKDRKERGEGKRRQSSQNNKFANISIESNIRRCSKKVDHGLLVPSQMQSRADATGRCCVTRRRRRRRKRKRKRIESACVRESRV